ncbi:MAG TPA: dTMP kinase [Myxococcaceae bacterium]|nr:dTMP kinase [Myxococcaceae bacterium]
MSRRGCLVVLEGLDGAGTTTQAARLAGRLRLAGRRVTLTREPSDGQIGQLLREVLRRGPRPGKRSLSDATLALLFAADRLEHVASTIAPALARGAVVVSDRYVLSSLAYQGRVLGRAWVESLNALAPAPDLTLFLEVRPAVAAARRRGRGSRRERFEDARTQREVGRAYASLVARHAQGHHIRTLDGERSVAEVGAEVEAAVAALLARRRARPGLG